MRKYNHLLSIYSSVPAMPASWEIIDFCGEQVLSKLSLQEVLSQFKYILQHRTELNKYYNLYRTYLLKIVDADAIKCMEDM